MRFQFFLSDPSPIIAFAVSTEELTDSLMLLRLINVTLAVEDASSNLVADVDV